jgi:hypothetical protein
MPHRRRLVCAASLALLAALAMQWAGQSRARAHPVSQGFMEIEVFRAKIEVRMRVSLEEVVISNRMRVADDDLYHPTSEHIKKHGEYLLKHVIVASDGKTLDGKVTVATEPEKLAEGVSPLDVQGMHATYEFEFAVSAPPKEIKVTQDVLNEVAYTPGNAWTATYVLRVLQNEGDGDEGLLLPSKTPLTFNFKWSEKPAVVAPPPGENPKPAEAPKATVRQDRWRMAWEYGRQGVKHILGPEEPGYDHLLFISALVLGAASLWDLLKVVTAFTLAHSLTLTLCVLDIVRLPERIVEPMIALSIVFVAVENIFWPQRTKGWGRLGAAFFFGLFHGLGFGGGLLEAMEGLGGGAVAVAIITFSIGVELGHQAVVLPLFGALRWLRRSQSDELKREEVTKLALKYGSMAISVAGVFFLVAALRWTDHAAVTQPPGSAKDEVRSAK